MDSPADDIWNEINEKEERAENISTRSNARMSHLCTRKYTK